LVLGLTALLALAQEDSDDGGDGPEVQIVEAVAQAIAAGANSPSTV
jgi:hypothetical protein